jgi:hypothetical protein
MTDTASVLPRSLARRLPLLRSLAAAVLIGFGLFAGGLLLYDMRWGPWMFSDSVAYVVSARNLAAGVGFGIPGPSGSFMPLQLHAPLYPLVMALPAALGIDPLTTSMAINITAFAGLVLLAGYGIYRYTGSFTWGLALAVILPFSRTLVANFDGAMSEPLAVLLTLVSLAFLALHLRAPSRLFWLLSALAAAGAALTRYSGLVSATLGCLTLLLFEPRPVRRRLALAAGYLLVGAAPLALWLAAQSLIYGSTASRTLRALPDLGPSLAQFRDALTNQLVLWLPYHYLLPGWRAKALLLYGAALLAALLLALAFLRWRRTPPAERSPQLTQGLFVAWLTGLFAAGYVAFLLASWLFSSLPPDLNERMFSILQPMLLAAGFGALITFGCAYRLPAWTALLPLFIAFVFYTGYRPYSIDRVKDRNLNGSGYTSVEWRASELIQQVKTLPPGAQLVSNETAVVLYYTNRNPHEIEAIFHLDPATGHPIDAASLFVQPTCAALVLFDQHLNYPVTDLRAAVAAYAPQALTLWSEAPDGAIWVTPACRP